MSKLPKEHKFIDLSDYGRPFAKVIANALKNTTFTPIHVTIGFIIAGIFAIYCIVHSHYWLAAFFLILKSILDAADGELARVKQKPSYTGRYLDSVADILLNALFFIAIRYIASTPIWICIGAFLGLQLQGTLYNYYYVILRNSVQGDSTSRVFENTKPKAFKGESQSRVNLFYKIYNILYICFDKIMYYMDKNARHCKPFPKWFMTLISLYGLGFQLLLMALMLVFKLQSFVIPFFIGYSVLIIVFICVRKLILKSF